MSRNVTNPHGFDAIVVGARCAGAATAMLLARAGARVLVVDREAYGSDTLSTHALMRTGVALLQRWNILDRVVAAGTPAVRSTTFVYGDERVEVEIKPGDGIDALLAPRRTVIDRLLVDAANEAGAEVRHGWSLQDLVRNDAGRITGAILRGPDGRTFVERANLVIGADGRQSSVARLAGAAELAMAPASSAGVYGYVPGIDNRGYRWFFRSGAHMAVIPTNNGAHCIGVFVPRSRYRDVFGSDAAAGFHACVATFDPALGEIVAGRAIDRLRRYAGAPGHLRQCHGNGWALVGDAGYFKDPVTAHGVTDALRDAALLASAVLGGEPGALAQYQEVRDQLSVPLFEVTGEIAAFGWTFERLKALHARLSATMKVELAHMMTAQTPPSLAA
jgi:2-polyprenyl-6-methoxyphenol hydroxylase-like FAD-dependent oxidoreductase